MKNENPDKLLASYRFWSLAAIGSFIIFVSLILILISAEKGNFMMFLFVFLSGLMWIGMTSISRHSFVLLKRYLGKEIGILEFLSTQLVVLLFPFAYRKVKKEIDLYREKNKG